jgi:hypothetical protein
MDKMKEKLINKLVKLGKDRDDIKHLNYNELEDIYKVLVKIGKPL